MKQWYVLRSKPRREAMAATFLASSGLDVYLPVMKARTRAGGQVATSEPLFPGYLFSRLDPNDGEFTVANHTYNVMYIVGYGDEPWPVSDELVSTIQHRLTSRSRRDENRSFQTGDSVLITNGPFKGIEAVFDGYLSAAGRVRVLIKSLQSAYRAEIDSDKLRVVGHTAKSAVA